MLPQFVANSYILLCKIDFLSVEIEKKKEQIYTFRFNFFFLLFWAILLTIGELPYFAVDFVAPVLIRIIKLQGKECNLLKKLTY